MSEDEQRVQVQIALWQMLEAEGMKPTADLVRRIRKLVEDGLKDRDVVLEEAAERAAFVAGYRAAHMVPDAYDSTSAAEEAWEGYRLVSRALKERV